MLFIITRFFVVIFTIDFWKMFQKHALENGKAYFYQVGNTQRIVKQWINSCLFSCDYKHKQWTSSPTSWSFCKSKMIFYWSKIDFLLLHKILDLKKKWHFTALYCFLTHIQKSPKVFGLVQNHFGQAKGQGKICGSPLTPIHLEIVVVWLYYYALFCMKYIYA